MQMNYSFEATGFLYAPTYEQVAGTYEQEPAKTRSRRSLRPTLVPTSGTSGDSCSAAECVSGTFF
jgi:hypothetical protein